MMQDKGFHMQVAADEPLLIGKSRAWKVPVWQTVASGQQTSL
jgi:hypothetical protein